MLTLERVWGWLRASDSFRPSQGLGLLVMTGIWNVSQGQSSLGVHPHPIGRKPPLASCLGRKLGGCRHQDRAQGPAQDSLFI